MITAPRTRLGYHAPGLFIRGVIGYEIGVVTSAIDTAVGVVYATVTARQLSASVTGRQLSISATPRRLNVTITTKEA